MLFVIPIVRLPDDRLRIAQVAPLFESVPPQLYGGTERVVAYLTETLVTLGHDVTLFASGDSRTAAELVAVTPRALRLAGCREDLAPHLVMLEEVYRRAPDFDIIHFHLDHMHFPLSRRERVTHVTTIHNRLDLPELQDLYRQFVDMPLVGISSSQQAAMPWANWQGTVYHGLGGSLHLDRGGDYLAFLGRISADKGIDHAIEIAKRCSLPLRIAAKLGAADRDYYEREIAPRRAAGIELVGEIDEAQKQGFLGGARALLFPIRWPEPFGMVVIEAMACGTPVIAYPCGSVPELVEDGVNGFICHDVEEAVQAVRRLDRLSRATCRARFEHRFTAQRMTRDYLEIYRRIIAAHEGRASSVYA